MLAEQVPIILSANTVLPPVLSFLNIDIFIQSITVPFPVTVLHNGSSCSVRPTFGAAAPILPTNGADAPDEGESLLTDRRRLQRYHRSRRPCL